MLFFSVIQVILTQLPGQEIQFELFDKDIDQDDFLGRWKLSTSTTNLALTGFSFKENQSMQRRMKYSLSLVFAGSSLTYEISSAHNSSIRLVTDSWTDHLANNIHIYFVTHIFLCHSYYSGTLWMMWSQAEFTWSWSGCLESLTYPDLSR